ncbi:Isoprene synthase, chloroplastic [Sesamum angolense]|uniref:Isoprene synthase, chloroplastic n=1 Tax=Sesamum angolense TaxID=2727404 RepID=A0AAE1XF36_9LAMI|nr:Isoprene synthase, chloroplastic [Sesamum angolense]
MMKLEEEIRGMLDDGNMEPLEVLELIDDIHRLGLGYRFRHDTKRALHRILASSDKVPDKFRKSVHASALYFKLLRQHGYEVPTDIFDCFKDQNSKLTTKDVQGMLSLYEASHVAFDGENTLDEGRESTNFHLKKMLGEVDKETGMRVRHALELPLYHKMQRVEARWNIEMYDKQNEANHVLHTLAILDFNMVQSQYQQELLQLSRWWAEIGLANKLSFARNRLMECFFWAIEMVFEPQHSKGRTELTKLAMLITVLDDVYDVYGSLEELEHFTDAVERWDINAVNYLPHYMKLAFLALYNTINNIAYNTLKEQDCVIIPTSTSEAKWKSEKYIPKFDEYMSYGCISSSGAVLLLHAYILTTQNRAEAVEYLMQYQGLVQLSADIFRLANDLGSSKADIEIGKTANAISCYMHETGETEEVARAYVRNLIHKNWKMLNKAVVHDSIFDNFFPEIAITLAQTALCQYQHGDAHSSPDDHSRNKMLSVISLRAFTLKTVHQGTTMMAHHRFLISSTLLLKVLDIPEPSYLRG